MTSVTSIVHSVTVADVLRLGGFESEPDKRGFLRCPIHSEQSASFHVIGDGTGWRCFGCGAKGGVLDLVVALGISPNRASAARWLEEVVR